MIKHTRAITEAVAAKGANILGDSAAVALTPLAHLSSSAASPRDTPVRMIWKRRGRFINPSTGKNEGTEMNWKERAAQLKTDIPALWLCLKAKETPVLAKVLAAITVGYALSPIDLIPDVIPVLGYLDDLILLPVLTALTLKCIPKEIFERCRMEAAGIWADGKPRSGITHFPSLRFGC